MVLPKRENNLFRIFVVDDFVTNHLMNLTKIVTHFCATFHASNFNTLVYIVCNLELSYAN